MQARPAYPVDAVTGGCFVTRRYELAPGELICDLDTNLDALPAWGRLCVSELGVRVMANCLGIDIPEANVIDANAKLREDNARLKAQNTQMRRAITEVLDAAKLAGITAWVEPLEAVS
jgi:hypothetical protein